MRLLSKPVLAIGAAAVLVASNVWISTSPPSSEPILAADRPVDLPDETTPSQPLPAAFESTQLTARPIFRVSRRPWMPPPPPEAPAPPPTAAAEPAPAAAPVQQVAELQVALFGLRMFPEGAEALIAKPGEATPQWLRTGEAVDGWTLTSVDGNTAKFSAGEATRTIELHVPLPESAPGQ